MSTLEVKIHKLVIEEHPNADALELARVGGYLAVVPKGAYTTGDYALYIPEGAAVPEDLAVEIGVEKYLGRGGRVRAAKLRGVLSQGIVCRPKALRGDWVGEWRDVGDSHFFDTLATTGADFAELLGITKWTPEIPLHLSGAVAAEPLFVPMYEVENIKSRMDMFDEDEYVIATEKIHGTNIGITYDVGEDKTWVSSKGLGQKHLVLQENDDNVYWRAAKGSGVIDFMQWIIDEKNWGPIAQTVVFGEVYGAGIQDLAYGWDRAAGPQLAIFDIKIVPADDARDEYWVNYATMAAMIRMYVTSCGGFGGNFHLVPALYEGPYDYNELCEVATGMSIAANDNGAPHVREGVVVKTFNDDDPHPVYGRRVAKFINPDYLLRGGEATEFE